MKKRSLKNLQLNKKSISHLGNFNLKGGKLRHTSNCPTTNSECIFNCTNTLKNCQ